MERDMFVLSKVGDMYIAEDFDKETHIGISKEYKEAIKLMEDERGKYE